MNRDNEITLTGLFREAAEAMVAAWANANPKTLNRMDEFTTLHSKIAFLSGQVANLEAMNAALRSDNAKLNDIMNHGRDPLMPTYDDLMREKRHLAEMNREQDDEINRLRGVMRDTILCASQFRK